jgi:hypothetical protein
MKKLDRKKNPSRNDRQHSKRWHGFNSHKNTSTMPSIQLLPDLSSRIKGAVHQHHPLSATPTDAAPSPPTVLGYRRRRCLLTTCACFARAARPCPNRHARLPPSSAANSTPPATALAKPCPRIARRCGRPAKPVPSRHARSVPPLPCLDSVCPSRRVTTPAAVPSLR